MARSGYINLIQPQDRRSLEAGDSRETVDARRALLDAGFGAALLAVLGEAVAELRLSRGSSVVDLGCGEGYFLASLCGRFDLEGLGVDLSAHAVERAARRYPNFTWIAANADRRLPFVDGVFSLALSIDGRRNRDETARVLAPNGSLVVAVPAADDLHELRAAVLGEAHTRDRSADLEAGLAPQFVLTARRVARARLRLDRTGLRHLSAATYRYARLRERDTLAEIAELEVTTSHEVLTLRRAT